MTEANDGQRRRLDETMKAMRSKIEQLVSAGIEFGSVTFHLKQGCVVDGEIGLSGRVVVK